MSPDVWSWLAGESFSGADGVPQLIWEHLWLSALSLLVAVAVAVPPAVWLAHHDRAPVLSVNAANAFRAVPAFGLLLVAFTVGGFSTWLLVAVFAVIGLAPIFANTYVGVSQIPADVVDAATGMGLRPGQVIREVELPLAVPVMLAGIRTGAVNIVATVTIASVVGFGGLGSPIVLGLSRNLSVSQDGRTLVIVGAATVALLSLATEGILGWVQRRLTPAGVAEEASAEEPDETRAADGRTPPI